MVNFKRSVLLSLFILLSSCFAYGDHYLTKQGGLRSEWKHVWYKSSRINPEDIGIDTDVIYTDFHFYKNGTCYRFNDYGNEKLNKTSFDPKNGDICFVIKRGKKYLLMTYNILDGGQFMKSEIRMKGDSLMIYSKNGQYEFLSYLEKKEVPKEWLDYEPDF